MTAPILVTGATGNTGRQVTAQLHAASVPVRAFVRDPQRAELPPSVEVVQGDLTDAASLELALNGVDAVFLMWPLFSAELAPPVVTTLAKHVRRVVYHSSDGVDDAAERQADPINQFHADLESLIAGTTLEWTFLRAGGMAVNALNWAEEIRTTGTVREPFPNASRTLVHEADIAAVAVGALTEDGHTGAKYRLTGPEILTGAEQIATIGAELDHEIRIEVPSAEESRAELLAAGMPADVVDGILNAHAAMETTPETISPTITEVTGAPARTFRQWVRDHRADFQ